MEDYTLRITDEQIYDVVEAHLKDLNRDLQELHGRCQETLSYLRDTSINNQ